MNVITQVDGDFADIRPLNESDRSALASKLLDAAGDRRREVRTVTGRSAGEFRVPVDIARAAGFLDDDSDEKAEKPARKTASRAKPKADDKAADNKPAEGKS